MAKMLPKPQNIRAGRGTLRKPTNTHRQTKERSTSKAELPTPKLGTGIKAKPVQSNQRVVGNVLNEAPANSPLAGLPNWTPEKQRRFDNPSPNDWFIKSLKNPFFLNMWKGVAKRASNRRKSN